MGAEVYIFPALSAYREKVSELNNFYNYPNENTFTYSCTSGKNNLIYNGIYSNNFYLKYTNSVHLTSDEYPLFGLSSYYLPTSAFHSEDED